MSIENQKTLEVYQNYADRYLHGGLLHDQKDPVKAIRKQAKLENFFKESLSEQKAGAKVFEIGSANGVNAKYIQSLGYQVTASDVSPTFIAQIQRQGLNPIKFNALEDQFPETYAAIICWRVFVHFTDADFQKTLQKVYAALEPNGVFIFNVFNREIRTVDQEWVDFSNEYHMGVQRFYHYFKQAEVEQMAKAVGFQIKNFFKQGGDNQDKWLVYVLKK